MRSTRVVTVLLCMIVGTGTGGIVQLSWNPSETSGCERVGGQHRECAERTCILLNGVWVCWDKVL